MNLASEIFNASRKDLIAYLNSWNYAPQDVDSDLELRLLAHKNFRREGPGAGPGSMGNPDTDKK